MLKYSLLTAMVFGIALSGVGHSSMSGDPFDQNLSGTIRSQSPAPDINQIGVVFQLDANELDELRAFLKDHNTIRMKVVAKVDTGIYVYPVPESAQVICKKQGEDDNGDDKPAYRSYAEIPGC